MKAADVFTPGKSPEITFVDDQLQNKKQQLNDALDMGSTVISLSGPSKSGKTVFIEKSLGKERLIQITGAGIDSVNKVWRRVLDRIGVPLAVKRTKKDGFKGNLTSKVSAGVNLVISGKGEVQTSGDWSKENSETNEYATDYLQLIIENLGGTEYVVFIDDFHYIPRNIQIELSNQIKEAVRENVCFVCATVPYRSDDVIRANTDLRGRIVNIDFNYWDSAELQKIAISGFKALNVSVSDAMIEAFASEAAGSPQLMQALCLYAAFELGIREKQVNKTKLNPNIAIIRKACIRTAEMTDYSSTVEKLKDGPVLSANENKQYLLKDDSISNIYKILLKSISLSPPKLTLRFPELVKRVASICRNDSPSTTSILESCDYLSTVANDSENMVVIEWDNDSDVLDIRDPYFLFYLRWS